MEYYLREIPYGNTMTAMVKPRLDGERILAEEGMIPVEIPPIEHERQVAGFFRRIWLHRKAMKNLDHAFAHLQKDDVMYIQYPLTGHSIFEKTVFRKSLKRGITVVLIMHDLELLRKMLNKETTFLKRLKHRIEAEGALKNTSLIVAHNRSMKNYLIRQGVEENKIVVLGIFDYLLNGRDTDSFTEREYLEDLPVTIAGNLHREKAEYVYHLPDNRSFFLYGPYYTGKENARIRHMGSFPPEELVDVMEGCLGLVWDGKSEKTCSGAWGEYLRVNNPHKTSLYLASGMPVIIWKEAALAEFMVENGCGLTVSSLHELKQVLSEVKPEDYKRLQENAVKAGRKIRKGFYLKTAIERCRKIICPEERVTHTGGDQDVNAD